MLKSDQADTPLMEAGLTSTSAVGFLAELLQVAAGCCTVRVMPMLNPVTFSRLRDELMKDLVGVNLPVTLVFDYPSISAMTELVLEGM